MLNFLVPQIYFHETGYPLVIARPRNVCDVSKIVVFIRDYGEGIVFCVASGGQSNKCMISESFVLDLVNLCEVDVNILNMTVSVGGGAYLRDVDRALAPHGLGVTLGTFPLTGR